MKKEREDKLAGKAAIVTGGNRGIGKGLALGLAREGADVALSWLSHREEAAAVVAEIRKMGRDAIAIQADMGKVADIEAMVATAVGRFGKIDILVNNAAVYPAHMFLSKTEEEVDRVLDVNLKGPFFCMQFVAKDMVKKGVKGSIINISSGHSVLGVPIGISDYAATKGGLNALTRAAGAELARYGIRVNCLILGLSRTPGMMQQQGMDMFEKYLLPAFPVPRFGEPEDYVGLLVWLASDESSYSTCACFTVDGGTTNVLLMPQPPAA